MGSLGTVDVVVLGGYFVVLGVISILVSRRTEKTTESYFLAHHAVPFWGVGASLFASNIGSEHFIGLAGSGYHDGIVVSWYEVGAMPIILVLAHFFLPIYLASGIQTTPDYLEKRYNLYCRTLFVWVSLALYVFSKISATLFAGQLIIRELIDIPDIVAVFILLVFTSLYTLAGGLSAIIYTETFQTVVLFVGGLLVLGFSLGSVGGWSGLVEGLENAGDVPEHYLDFFHPNDPVYPISGLLIGYQFASLFYWGIDMVIVQRALAGKSIADAQLGCVLAALMKSFPLLMMVVPGLCARVLVHQRLDETSLAEFNPDTSYPWLVLNVVPENLRGLIIASMLSALMSALASVFSSAATLFSLNVFKVYHPSATEAQLVRVGRLTVVVLAILSLVWLPVMPLLGNSLFLIIQKPPAYVAPPILSAYLWGMLSKVPNAKGCTLSLTIGIVLGASRFTLEVIEDAIGSKVFGAFTGLNFLHFAAVSFLLSTFMLFFFSFLFRRHHQEVDSSLFYKRGLFEELMRSQGLSKGLEPIALSEDDEINGNDSNDSSNSTSVKNGSQVRDGVTVELTQVRRRSSSDTAGSPRKSQGRMTMSGIGEVQDVDLSELALNDTLPSFESSDCEDFNQNLQTRVSEVGDDQQDAASSRIIPQTCITKRMIRGFTVVALVVWFSLLVGFR